ncbi:MAG: transposase [Myxococcota bacterium]
MSLPRCVLEGTTYLVTRRCLGRRFLLRPDPALNGLFAYCLGRAADKYGIEIHALSVMSNHYHLVLTDVRGVLPEFMRTLNRSLAMSVKRLRRWDEVLWEPNVPYNAVALSGPTEVLDKVAYTLLNPVSAVLVRTPERWPGLVSTLKRLRRGVLEARRPGLWFKDAAPPKATVRFTVPPGFSGQESYFGALRSLLRTRLKALHAEHRRRGLRYLGALRAQRTPVTEAPKTKKPRFGRSPTFSALTRADWLRALKRLRAFRRAYRAAYEAWRNGERDTEFPPGTWWVVHHAGALAAA